MNFYGFFMETKYGIEPILILTKTRNFTKERNFSQKQKAILVRKIKLLVKNGNFTKNEEKSNFSSKIEILTQK